ncbi:MAG: J domain-containing protein [Isosphaeraceae bacterium]
MLHHFSLEPRAVLGVGPDASMEEIHRAFLAKSKTYHPDHGGDEWAFKVVARAYEILKATDGVGRQPPAAERPPDRGTSATRSRPEGTDPLRRQFFTVDAELVWIRCEGSPLPGAGARARGTAMTLSVCLVVSWPRAALVRRSVDFPEAGETLSLVIRAFDHLRAQPAVIDSRSRIEDGQFVGWLSYPSVVDAEDAFHALSQELSIHRLGVNLCTRDEQVPAEWLEP